MNGPTPLLSEWPGDSACVPFSVLTLMVELQEGHPTSKNNHGLYGSISCCKSD